MDTPIGRAIAAAGGPAELARRISALQGRITTQAVCEWKRCPAARVLVVERVTGISRHELRPDLYPPEPEATPGEKAAA